MSLESGRAVGGPLYRSRPEMVAMFDQSIDDGGEEAPRCMALVREGRYREQENSHLKWPDHTAP